MSYKYSFADNEIYGASDINAITKRLVTSGVEDSFTDGVAYNVSRFNDAGKLLYTSGAVPESYLSLKVEDAGDGKILINPGKAFFDDGAVIEIEAGGETLPYVSGSKNYVYLKNDLINTNRCYPCCTASEPEGDYVLLAEIDASGNIQDKRTYARGKLPGYQGVAGNVIILNETVSFKGSGSMIKGSVQFDIGENDFEYILTMRPGNSYSDSSDFLGIYNISENTYMGFGVYSDSRRHYSTSELYLYCDYTIYLIGSFSLSDGILTIDMTAIDQNAFEQGTHTFPLYLVLF